MKCEVIYDYLEVDNQLAELSLNRNSLVTAVRFAESEAALCTANDPIGFDRYLVYAKAGRKLREEFLPEGWERDDTNNQCAIRSREKKIRIVPCNFDEGCGNHLVMPSNRSPKGEVSRKKTMCNRTAWLPGLPKPYTLVNYDEYVTWILGIHIHNDFSARAELSMPIEFDGKYYKDFSKRLILLDGTEDEPIEENQNDSDTFEVIDIEVKRK